MAILDLFSWVPALLLDVRLSIEEAARAVLNLWPLCAFFGGLGLLCSAVFHRRVLAIAIPGALLVAAHFVNALANLVKELREVQPFSVFHYYGSALEDGIDWADFLGVALAALVLVVLALLAFRQRDIYT